MSGAAKTVVIEKAQILMDQGMRQVFGHQPMEKQAIINKHGFDGLFLAGAKCFRWRLKLVVNLPAVVQKHKKVSLVAHIAAAQSWRSALIGTNFRLVLHEDAVASLLQIAASDGTSIFLRWKKRNAANIFRLLSYE
jgi:hypothetical protein